jgi:membrane-bound serine protease (ClpP class)
MMPMVWPILLLLLGLLFVVLELFVPSGGVLGILAGLSVLASIYVGFSSGGIWNGVLAMAMALLVVPVVLAVAIKVWPHTPIGRRILLQPAAGGAGQSGDTGELERQRLVGKFGMAKSKMLPAGAVLIEGQMYDAVSRGNPIEAGEPIRVISVSGNRIVVAPADAQQALQARVQSEDVLSQPIDALGLDPFDHPLS